MKKGKSIQTDNRIKEDILKYLSSKDNSEKREIAFGLSLELNIRPRIFRATMKSILQRKRDFNTIEKAIERIS